MSFLATVIPIIIQYTDQQLIIHHDSIVLCFKKYNKYIYITFPPGITHEEMVQESKRHWQRLEQNAQKQQKVRQDSPPPLSDLSRASSHLPALVVNPGSCATPPLTVL